MMKFKDLTISVAGIKLDEKDFLYEDLIHHEIRGTDTIIYTKDIDIGGHETLTQIYDMAKGLPDTKIRVMPDFHGGKGCVIGTTMVLNKDRLVVNPSYVGVDIGCGVSSAVYKFNGISDEDISQTIEDIINNGIPSGKNGHKKAKVKYQEENLYSKLMCIRWIAGHNINSAIMKSMDWWDLSIGTLGGGNHFIEVGKDSDGLHYITIHSGSRNLGAVVAEHYISMAQHTGGFLSGGLAEEYIHDMKLCSRYAEMNRSVMHDIILQGLIKKYNLDSVNVEYIKEINTVHNYIDDNYILRKGAISAYKDEIVLIPMNMRDGIIIARGKGNPNWNYSAPHGAGRIYSRSKAKSQLSLEDFKSDMEGIFSSCVGEHTIDESPRAYKAMEDIVDVVGDTVEILDIIKPIYNFKA